jgi:hypothetical protein
MRLKVIGFAVAALVSAPAQAQTSVDLAGAWEGSYMCGQGETRLRLVITPDGKEGALRAEFLFSAMRSNPNVPTGSYRLTGEISRAGVFELRPQAWNVRPQGFDMVGLRGVIENGRLTGQITNPNCSWFRLARAG